MWARSGLAAKTHYFGGSSTSYRKKKTRCSGQKHSGWEKYPFNSTSEIGHSSKFLIKHDLQIQVWVSVFNHGGVRIVSLWARFRADLEGKDRKTDVEHLALLSNYMCRLMFFFLVLPPCNLKLCYKVHNYLDRYISRWINHITIYKLLLFISGNIFAL